MIIALHHGGKELNHYYENMPIQLSEICLALEIENFVGNFFYIFLIFAQNIYCGYYPCSEYPQSMFCSKNKKNRYNPCIPQLYFIKVGYKGVYISRTCFPDVIKTKL